MKPSNVSPDLLLEDGEPVTCSFMAKADPPVFWERCETNATGILTQELLEGFYLWQQTHPQNIVRLYPGTPSLCDTHLADIQECQV